MKRSRDTYRSVRDEREYGPYWYSLLWRLIRPALVLAGAALVVVGIISSIWGWAYDNYLAPPDPAAQAGVRFDVESGQSLTRVANNLEAAGLIRNRTVFKYYCDFAGMGQKIQAGTYVLQPSMSMQEIANRLTMGDGNPIVRNITLIPGRTLEEFAQELAVQGVLTDTTEFLELCRTGENYRDYYYIADVLASGNSSQRKYVLEGYLSPNTYEVYMDATPDDIIRKLLSQTDNTYPITSQARAEELNMSMDDVFTLASLIEKEAKEEDFAKVSAVFHNRLKAGMKLQSDVTIHYVTAVRKMSLDANDLAINSPYNTYKFGGLPLGPICNPSQSAIEAALYPDPAYLAQNYLYFCAKDPESGELHFSTNLKDHEAAVALYAPSWQEYDRKRGIE